MPLSLRGGIVFHPGPISFGNSQDEEPHRILSTPDIGELSTSENFIEDGRKNAESAAAASFLNKFTDLYKGS